MYNFLCYKKKVIKSMLKASSPSAPKASVSLQKKVSNDRLRRNVIIHLFQPIQELVPFNIYQPKLLSFLLTLCLKRGLDNNNLVNISRQTFASGKKTTLRNSKRTTLTTQHTKHQTPITAHNTLDKDKEQLISAIVKHRAEFDKVTEMLMKSMAILIPLGLMHLPTIKKWKRKSELLKIISTYCGYNISSSNNDISIEEIEAFPNIDEYIEFMTDGCKNIEKRRRNIMSKFHSDKFKKSKERLTNLLSIGINKKVEECQKRQRERDEDDDEDQDRSGDEDQDRSGDEDQERQQDEDQDQH
jgi:hypothetical protein